MWCGGGGGGGGGGGVVVWWWCGGGGGGGGGCGCGGGGGGGVVVWWCGGVVVWCVVVWWCGGVVVWWCGGVVVWWCGGVVVWWCGGVVVWQRDLNVFSREELSLKVLKVFKEWAVSRQKKIFSSRPFQTVLIQTHRLTSGDVLRVAMKPIMTVKRSPPVSKVILFPTNATLLPVPSSLKTTQQGGVSAHLPTFHRAP